MARPNLSDSCGSNRVLPRGLSLSKLMGEEYTVTCGIVSIMSESVAPEETPEKAQEKIDEAFATFPVLETANLCLREVRSTDADALFDVFADEVVTRYYDLYPFDNRDEVMGLIDFFAESFELERSIRWAITRKSDDLLLGTCGYVWLRPFRGEIGYELGLAHWRQGIMSEALPAIIDFGYTTLGLNRIEALVMVENVGSAALLASLGFTEEGTLREHDFFKEAFHDMRSFALLKRDWMQDAG